ncbi:MAG: hypothetical protein ACYSU0_22205 [Planctomycetota bacterium]|jgi:hypothetical protein
MKRMAIAVSGLLLVCCTVLAGRPEFKVLPGSANWVAQLDVRRLLATEVGGLIRAAAQKPRPRARIDAVKALFSVDLLSDIHSLTLCGEGAGPETSVLYVQGNFDKEKLVTILRALDGYREIAYRDHVILRLPNKKSKERVSYGCFARADLVVVSESRKTLEGALDVLDGKGRSLADRELFADLTDPRREFVFLAAAKDIHDMQGVRPKAAILGHIVDLVLRVDEKEGNVIAVLTLVADDATSATRFAQVVQGLQAAALLNEADKPQLAELARRLTVQSNGRSVQITLALPVDMVRKAAEQPVKRGGPRQDKDDRAAW